MVVYYASMRARSLIPFLAVAVGIAVPSAGATGLYTTAAPPALVPVNTVITASSGVVTFTSGAATINSCTTSSLTLKVTANTGGAVNSVKFQVTGGAFNMCTFPIVVNAPWNSVTVSGGSVAVGTDSVWANTTITGVSLSWLGSPYTGTLTAAGGAPPANGMSMRQPTAAGVPVSLVAANAPKLVGALTANGKVNGTWTLGGAAATYTLGP